MGNKKRYVCLNCNENSELEDYEAIGWMVLHWGHDAIISFVDNEGSLQTIILQVK